MDIEPLTLKKEEEEEEWATSGLKYILRRRCLSVSDLERGVRDMSPGLSVASQNKLFWPFIKKADITH